MSATSRMSAVELADRIGCEVQTIRRWRTGKRKLGIQYMRRIAELDAELSKPPSVKTISPSWFGRCPSFRPTYPENEHFR